MSMVFASHRNSADADREPIAIIGMAGRFPGASDVDGFWHNVKSGTTSISALDLRRLEDNYSDSIRSNPHFVAARPLLENTDYFDADFFRMHPREAALTDPQHRVFLECSWNALESAGYDPAKSPLVIGVIAGCSLNTYFLHHVCTDRRAIETFTSNFQLGSYPELLGAGQDFLSTRVAYKLDLRGPAMTLGTACSTSLAAVAQACQALQFRQADLMLAGGVSISFPQNRGYIHVPGGMASADGACRPFDAAASGTVFGSGAAVVVLRRLSDAVAAGDTIHAVIRGSSANNDGARKVGFTAPSVEGQIEVIRDAHRRSGIDARSIGYIECHGTATPLGDPIEFEAMARAFRSSTADRGFCALGSAKANVGHLDAAAGVTGLIKAVFCVRDGVLPPMAGFNDANHLLNIGESPFRIDKELRSWPDSVDPRRAGVSALGVGGTNVHVVIEEPPRSKDEGDDRELPTSTTRPVVLPISARSSTALDESRSALARHLEENTTVPLQAVAFTLQQTRRGFDHRAAFVGRSRADLIAALRAEPAAPRLVEDLPVPIVFMFPGQGAQYQGMGAGLYDKEPFYRSIVDEGAAILEPLLNVDIRDFLKRRDAGDAVAADHIRSTQFAQPSLFLVQYALARLWMHWGVEPAALVGHSVGEVVCAALAGVFSFEAALHFVAERGRLMAEVSPGSMIAVRLGEDRLRAIMPASLSIAAVNAPKSCVVSGPTAAVEAFQGILSADNIAQRLLKTSHAFHSSMMDSVLDPLVDHLRPITFGAPTIPMISGVTGDWVGSSELCPEYWASHCRSCIRFSDALVCAVGDDRPVLLESGPGRTLNALSSQILPKGALRGGLSSLPEAGETAQKDDDDEVISAAAGALWTFGVDLCWDRLQAHKPHRVPLPTHPFDRKRHWIESPISDRAPPTPVKPVDILIPISKGEKAMQAPAPNPSAKDVPAAPDAQSAQRRIEDRLLLILRDLSGEDVDGSLRQASFLELGFDSLFLAQFVVAISSTFDVSVSFRQLLDDLSTVEAVASRIAIERPELAEPSAVSSHSAVTDAPCATDADKPSVADDTPTELPGLHRVLTQQIATMQALFSEQLHLLGAAGGAAAGKATRQPTLPTHGTAHGTASDVKPSSAESAASSSSRLLVYGTTKPVASAAFTPAQRQFIDDLCHRYNLRTAGSKRAAQSDRAVLADPRAAAGFRREWKELVYPLVCVRSRGSKIWDIDGNSYIDLVNGYGQTFFGHAPDFITEAVADQLRAGFAIGPQTALAGEVATLINRLTGIERVTFCNTGSEAVMAAMRVARTVTGRKTVVMFDGAYHGQFDEVLVKSGTRDGSPGAKPSAPGIPEASVANMIVLPYGTEQSLNWIRDNAAQLAAVIVEPVQSRRPDFLPTAFIAGLRSITADSKTALVFDEVVTGFRVHPGGMQAVLDLRADMVTYGKVVGGGLPIGVLSGTKRFMDALDGGHWRFGDESFPETAPTFFAGTFVRHPLALAAAKAVLGRVEAEGPALQRAVTQTTTAFVERFNKDLERRGLASRAQSYSSWFYFNPSHEDRLASLFFHHARLLGVQIQEGFPCFITTEHSADDLDAVFTAFTTSLDALSQAGILVGRSPAEEIALVDAPMLPQVVPWTEPQKEIWLTAQMGEAASCAFNESLSLTLTGDVDVDALTATLDEVVARHDALNARFDPDREMMIVDGATAIQPQIVDLRDAAVPDKSLRALLDADSKMPFNLITGPLMRVTVVRLAGDRQVVVLTAHHIICDGWSFNVIVNDLLTCYKERRAGSSFRAAKTPSFRTYALEQTRLQERKTVCEAYWLDRFALPTADLDLPSDRARPQRKSFKGATHHETISKKQFEGLRAVGARYGCTTFATLLTALQVVVGRLSGTSDVVIAIPTAGQSLGGVHDLVGHCVNLLPLRVELDWTAAIMEQARATKARLLDAFEHQDFTYGTLVRKLRLARNLDRLPLTQIQFNLEKLTVGPSIPGLSVTSAANDKSFSNFDLFFNFVERDDALSLDCDYNTDLFDPETVSRWIDHLRNVISAMITNPDMSVADVPLSNGDEQQMLQRLSAGTTTLDLDLRPVHRLVADRARHTPEAIAVAWRDQTLTFSDLDAKANRLARHINDLVPEPGRRIAVATARSPNLLIALLAVLKAGHAYVPLDLQQPRARQRMILDDAQVAALISDETAFTADYPGFPVIDLLRDAPTIDAIPNSDPDLDDECAIDRSAYVVFTSGSTGRPKGVEVSHRSLVNLLWSMARRPGFSAQDRLLAVTTITFDIAAAELFLPLIVGGRVVVADRAEVIDGFALLKRLEASQVTVMQATPSLWRLLAEAGFISKPNLTMISGGEPLSRDLADDLMAGGGTLWNAYGPTETTIWSSFSRVSSAPITIGEPVLNTQLHVLDERERPTVIGVEGRLFIGGSGLAKGYVGREDLTTRAFRQITLPASSTERLYDTGDRARRLTDGSIQVVGRADTQIKLRGFRIELEEIEAALRRCPGVNAAAVMVRDKQGEDRRLVGYVVPSPRSSLSTESIRAHIMNQLPDYMVPRVFLQLEALPLTSNGKLDRQRLSTMDVDEVLSDAKRPAISPMQTQMVRIFAEILKLDEIGIDDDIFSLGVDSFQLFQITARMRKIGIDLDVGDLMANPTVSELAEKVTSLRTSNIVDERSSLRAFKRSNQQVTS